MHCTSIKDIAVKEIFPGFYGRFLHTQTMTFAFWEITSGSTVPEHSHMHEQVAQLIDGKFELTVDGITYPMLPGQLITIPPHVRHSGKAITNCSLVDVFSPVREDYRL